MPLSVAIGNMIDEELNSEFAVEKQISQISLLSVLGKIFFQNFGCFRRQTPVYK
jgi:hypothetical protein